MKKNIFVCLTIAALSMGMQTATNIFASPAMTDETRNTLILEKSIPADNAEIVSMETIELIYSNYAKNIFIGGIDATKQPIKLLDKNTGKEIASGTVTVPSSMSVMVTLDKTITNPGTYELLIPEALVYDNHCDFADFEKKHVDTNGVNSKASTYNPEQRLTFTILELQQDTSVENVTPEPNTGLSDVSTVAITFTDIVKVESAIVRTSRDRSIIDKITIEDNVLTIDLTEIAYSLVANGGFEIEMQVKDKNENYITYGNKMGYVTLYYFCIATRSQYSYIYTKPEGNSQVSSLGEILLVFKDEFSENELYVGCVDQTKHAALLEEFSGDTIAIGKLSLEKEKTTDADYYGVKVTLNKEITTPGKYSLLIPEKSIFNKFANPEKPDFGISEDEAVKIIYNPYIYLSFEVTGNTPVNPDKQNTFAMQQADPANQSTVEKIKDIYMSFANTDNSTFIGGLDGSKAHVELKTLTNNETVAKGIVSWYSTSKVLLTFEKEVTPPGTYTINIPEGLIFDDKADIELIDKEKHYIDPNAPEVAESHYNPEFTLTYIIEINPNGINSIDSFKEEVTVYNLQGILLGKGESTSILQSLEKGFYIVNGKKVVIY